MSKSIGVVGAGFVGSAVARGFITFFDVKVYDIKPENATHSIEETIKSDFIFVCLPTPMERAEGGKCDLSIMRKFFADYKSLDYNPETVLVIKSTIPPGTTRSIANDYGLQSQLVHYPEFLTARTATIDFITPSRHIIGSMEEMPAVKLENLLKQRFPSVPCHRMGTEEAELVKYGCNCFFATKVMFFNELKMLIDSMDLNWNDFLNGVLSDGRIALSHTDVPGHDGDAGYGGSCFPKDVNAIIATMEKMGLDPKLLKAGWEQNKALRKNWDWAKNESAVSNRE